MVKTIQIPKILDERGNLSFIENYNHIPFQIKRAYWIYDVPGGEVRGGHAYKMLEETIIAISGSFELRVDDGMGKALTFHMNRSYEGVYVPENTWRELCNFSTNAVALILASRDYDKSDYINKYEDFIKIVNEHNNS